VELSLDMIMVVQERGCEGVDWTHLARDRDQWRILVNMAMNIHVHKMSKTPSLTERPFISQGRVTARAVSHRPLTADASGAFQSSSCEICGSGVPRGGGSNTPPPPTSPKKIPGYTTGRG
jgi:hypothetical protein